MFLFMLSFLGLAPTFQKSKCKKLLNITMERIKLLKSRREVQLRQLHVDLAQLRKLHKEQKVQVWLGRIWKERCLLSVYAKIADYCQSVQTNLNDIAGQRECPGNLVEPLAGLCFAASRCADLPELQEFCEILAMKYGKGFVTSAQELRGDCHVNQQFLDDLCAKIPSDVALMEEISGQASDNEQPRIHGSSSTEVSVDADECNQPQVQQEQIDHRMMDLEVKDGKDELGRNEELQETDVVQERDNQAATVICEGDSGTAEVANRKRTLEGRQTRRSKLKRAFRKKAAHEKTADKVQLYCVGEEGQGVENGINERGALRLPDTHRDDGLFRGEGTSADMNIEAEAPAEDQHNIILYVEEPCFSMPPQRTPPPCPPPTRAPPLPPSLQIVSMPPSHNKQANAPLPLRCSTMANNHFIESHVHPKLPKYENFVANFTALRREAF
eukprot:c25341_g1_i10 orf=565-1890(-)